LYGVQWSFTAAGVPKMEKIKDDDSVTTLSSGVDFHMKYNIPQIEMTKRNANPSGSSST
jgi:hypothetical protein